MNKTLLILLILAGLSTAGVYRDSGLGLYPFLKMDVGARVAALGGTGAVNGDELAIFSNPALIAGMGTSLSAGHNQWFGTTIQNYVAATSQLGSIFTGSLALRSVSTTGIEYRETPTSDPVDTFNATDFSANGAVAARMGRFDAGIGFKLIHEKIWLESSNGWAVDLGFNYHPHSSLVFSAAYLHSGPSVTMIEEEFRFPRTWVFASRWNGEVPFGSLSLSGQIMRPLDNRTNAGFGVEFSPLTWASLRGGWKINDDSGDLTAGAGVSVKSWTLDYAFVPGDFSLGTTHRFSLSRSL
ncbi:MAG: PorV/PorQ family protein [Candidatus Sabulitectum sp.]|nr:PorV/PorQ family protein [Candidatus Sabulitectum sp.]